MWAAGDALLYIFIACLFMVPNHFVVVIARFEAFYKAYSQLLVAQPECTTLCKCIHFGENHVVQTLNILCC